MSVQQYGRKFPVLLRMQNPRGLVELTETVGKGNYGYVYKGRLVKNNIIAAVKVVQLKEDEIKETLLEMEILENCHHQNITKFLICMEFCGAGSLDTFYRALKKSISEDALACILYESIRGLEYLHNTAALIHRDIKAGNLLLTEDGHLKLADFGVSAQLDKVGGNASTFIGTPYWMAPEVIMTEEDDYSYTSKADIWSIGITAIEIAEKNPPLSDLHPMRALKMIPTSEMGLARPKNFSKPFVEFVNVCLTRDPAKRPSATELLTYAFIAKAAVMPRQKIMTDLVHDVTVAKAKKKAGGSVDEEDEDEKKPEVQSQSVAEAVKYATQARLNPNQAIVPTHMPISSTFGLFTSNSQAMEMRAINVNDFSPLINKVQDILQQVFDPVPILAVNLEVYSCEILDTDFLLLASEKGLFFVDMKQQTRIPIPIIHNVRFRQIQIIHNHNVLIALSGKRDHVRQYNLASIRKMIHYLQGQDPLQLKKMDFTVRMQDAQLMSSQTTIDAEYMNVRPDEYQDESSLVAHWSSDYLKIQGTQHSKAFIIEHTETTSYLSVLFNKDLTLFEWAKKPYSKFMKLKKFWLPESPKFISLSQDGLDIKDVYLGYANEMNIVSVDNSKVRDIPVHKDYLLDKSSGKERWRAFVQIPPSDAALGAFISSNMKNIGVVKSKLAAVTLNHNTRTSSSELTFLGTFNRITKVVNNIGVPVTGTGDVAAWERGVVWSEAPQKIILRPSENVISVGKNTVEIVSWESADLKQRLHVDSPSSLNVLNASHGSTVIGVQKKKKGTVMYLMKESSTTPRIPGELLKSIMNTPGSRPMSDASQVSSVKIVAEQINTLLINNDAMISMNPSPPPKSSPPAFKTPNLSTHIQSASAENAFSFNRDDRTITPPSVQYTPNPNRNSIQKPAPIDETQIQQSSNNYLSSIIDSYIRPDNDSNDPTPSERHQQVLPGSNRSDIRQYISASSVSSEPTRSSFIRPSFNPQYANPPRHELDPRFRPQMYSDQMYDMIASNNGTHHPSMYRPRPMMNPQAAPPVRHQIDPRQMPRGPNYPRPMYEQIQYRPQRPENYLHDQSQSRPQRPDYGYISHDQIGSPHHRPRPQTPNNGYVGPDPLGSHPQRPEYRYPVDPRYFRPQPHMPQGRPRPLYRPQSPSQRLSRYNGELQLGPRTNNGEHAKNEMPKQPDSN